MTNNLIVSSNWVRENDTAIYDALHEMLIDFVNDEYDYRDATDLKEFEKGNWVVEYTFREDRESNKIKILVSAGKSGQHLALQPTWIQENISKKEFDSLYPKMVYIEI